MLFPQFVEGVTLKPRFMVSAWLRRDLADAIMSELRRKSRASGALERASQKSGCRFFAQRARQTFGIDRVVCLSAIPPERNAIQDAASAAAAWRHEPEPASLWKRRAMSL
jgi:hypothetical protein